MGTGARLAASDSVRKLQAALHTKAKRSLAYRFNTLLNSRLERLIWSNSTVST